MKKSSYIFLIILVATLSSCNGNIEASGIPAFIQVGKSYKINNDTEGDYYYAPIYTVLSVDKGWAKVRVDIKKMKPFEIWLNLNNIDRIIEITNAK